MSTHATEAVPDKADKKATPDRDDAVIVVNGTEYAVESLMVSYEQLVSIAYPTPPGPDIYFNITYRKAKEPHHEGSLAPGHSVEVKKKGTIFNVTPTNKS